MSEETLVAVYDTPAHALLAVGDLKQAGIPESAIGVHDSASTAGSGAITALIEQKGFWSDLLGGEPEHDSVVFDRSLAAGSTVVTVRVSESYTAKAAEIMESHQPIDIDERANGYGLTGRAREPLGAAIQPTDTTAVVSQSEGTLQLSEERLSVGKRLVNRGGTRIRRFVVEMPVEEEITLHDERVTIERRAVTDGRPATNADFTDKVIEMTETTEEVVVSKRAFVTEEIALTKHANDRVETIRETVRREEVEIEQIPQGEVTTSASAITPVTPLTDSPA